MLMNATQVPLKDDDIILAEFGGGQTKDQVKLSSGTCILVA